MSHQEPQGPLTGTLRSCLLGSLHSGNCGLTPTSWSRHQGDAEPAIPGLLLHWVLEPLGPSLPGQEASHSCCQWLRCECPPESPLTQSRVPYGTVLGSVNYHRFYFEKALVPRPGGLSPWMPESQGLGGEEVFQHLLL